jgi:hypothetical protein
MQQETAAAAAAAAAAAKATIVESSYRAANAELSCESPAINWRNEYECCRKTDCDNSGTAEIAHIRGNSLSGYRPGVRTNGRQVAPS